MGTLDISIFILQLALVSFMVEPADKHYHNIVIYHYQQLPYRQFNSFFATIFILFWMHYHQKNKLTQTFLFIDLVIISSNLTFKSTNFLCFSIITEVYLLDFKICF